MCGMCSHHMCKGHWRMRHVAYHAHDALIHLQVQRYMTPQPLPRHTRWHARRRSKFSKIPYCYTIYYLTWPRVILRRKLCSQLDYVLIYVRVYLYRAQTSTGRRRVIVSSKVDRKKPAPPGVFLWWVVSKPKTRRKRNPPDEQTSKLIIFGGYSSRWILFLRFLGLETTQLRNTPGGGSFFRSILSLSHFKS